MIHENSRYATRIRQNSSSRPRFLVDAKCVRAPRGKQISNALFYSLSLSQFSTLFRAKRSEIRLLHDRVMPGYSGSARNIRNSYCWEPVNGRVWTTSKNYEPVGSLDISRVFFTVKVFAPVRIQRLLKRGGKSTFYLIASRSFLYLLGVKYGILPYG